MNEVFKSQEFIQISDEYKVCLNSGININFIFKTFKLLLKDLIQEIVEKSSFKDTTFTNFKIGDLLFVQVIIVYIIYRFFIIKILNFLNKECNWIKFA